MGISQLLAGASARSEIRLRRYEEDEEDEEPYAVLSLPEITEPQKAGVELLMSGEFGRVGSKIKSRAKDINITKYLNKRSTRLHQTPYKEDLISVRLHFGTHRLNAHYS
jgi:hypothetical protein